MNWGEAVSSVFSPSAAKVVQRILSARPQKSDVIVCFCGLPRNANVMARLYVNGFAPRIDSLGNNSYPCRRNPNQDAYVYAKMCEKKGVPKKAVFVDNTLTNTKEAADFEVLRAKKLKWTTILYVAQGYHMPRAYATFVKALIERGLEKKIKVVPQPLMRRDWSAKDGDLRNSWRDELVREELPRINKYQKKGDVASWARVEAYLDFWML